jgi:adenylate cyclase
MADIFISYSSKDRDKAEQLTELLASAGLSVWIDKQGIQAATSWSEEIVDAIDNCRTFILMLSSSSVASHNVVKEVSLASEKQKKILPIDLEPVEIPKNMQYALAGIQRTPISNIDGVIRALARLGLEATRTPLISFITEADSRKSVMVLPFEDLSPTGDNGWFADGIAAELISTLANVRSLRVVDQQTTKGFKNYRGALATYAKEMSIRYFIQGSVRKFGDQIKISSTLLDIETGDHLWQDSLKGTMEDIFDIQETVAKKVVEGLQVILTKEEEQKIDTKPTENSEAYELYLKALEYFSRHTKENFERATLLFESAVELDPSFTPALANLAHIYTEYYILFERKPAIIEKAIYFAQKLYDRAGEIPQYDFVMSRISFIQKDYQAAIDFAMRAVKLDPTYASSYYALSMAYRSLGKKRESAEAAEEYVKYRTEKKNAYHNLLVAINELGDTEWLRRVSAEAVPVISRHARLNPDDTNARSQLASTYVFMGDTRSALRTVDELSLAPGLDSSVLYNISCTYLACGATDRAFNSLHNAVEKGFANIELLKGDPDFDPYREMPEYRTILGQLEEKLTTKD